MTKYVYICSAGHSGSTLLDLLLGSHSRIASLGELYLLSKNLALNTQCSCGQPVRSCNVWRQVISRVSDRIGADVMSQPYALRMWYPKASVVIDRKHQTSAYLLHRKLVLGVYYLYMRFGLRALAPLVQPVHRALSNTFLVFDVVRDVLGVDIVADSSKSYLKAVGLYSRDPGNVRILLLTRDGRGVYWSNLKRGRPRREIVRAWRHQYARALRLLQQHVQPEHLLRVKYEDLATEPARELRRICSFLGQPFEPEMQDFHRKVHHVTNGNDMRLNRSTSVGLDIEWQQQLKAPDLEYFERQAGWLNRELGYQ